MRDVAILGIGQTEIDEHWDKSLRLLAGEAVISAIQASPDSPGWLDAVATLYFLGELGVGLIAVASQTRTDLPRPLKRWAITALVSLSLLVVIGFYAAIIGTAFVANQPPPALGTPEMSGPLEMTFSVIGVATALALVVGWFAVRKAGRAGAPEPA